MATSEENWEESLLTGLLRWSDKCEPREVCGITVSMLKPTSQLIILSGMTPGPLYHSHPHIPSEFDASPKDMEGQVEFNMKTIDKILNSCKEVSKTSMSPWYGGAEMFHFVTCSVMGHGVFEEVKAANIKQCLTATGISLKKRDVDDSVVKQRTYPVVRNVTDPRFLIETVALYSIEGGPSSQTPLITQIDVKEDFDPKYFMPYVPAFLVSGGKLAIFTVNAASGSQSSSVPKGGEEQVSRAITSMNEVLSGLGCTFDDVVLIWDRVVDLETNENFVLMGRSKAGLDRPVAEAVLEVPLGSNGTAADGTELLVEFVVCALCKE